MVQRLLHKQNNQGIVVCICRICSYNMLCAKMYRCSGCDGRDGVLDSIAIRSSTWFVGGTNFLALKAIISLAFF